MQAINCQQEINKSSLRKCIAVIQAQTRIYSVSVRTTQLFFQEATATTRDLFIIIIIITTLLKEKWSKLRRKNLFDKHRYHCNQYAVLKHLSTTKQIYHNQASDTPRKNSA